jgi:hypothetical protein
MLEARHVAIFTDHNPMTYAFGTKGDKCMSRQLNHPDFISPFTIDIRHIFGQDNVVADALFRVEVVFTPLSPEALVEAQSTDTERAVLSQGTAALNLERIHVPGSEVVRYCDMSTTSPRPYVLETL